jgi:indole-3-glycerol phosphate synthase
MKQVAGILSEIVGYKKEFLEIAKRRRSQPEIKSRINQASDIVPFAEKLRGSECGVRVIAEVKKASPSKGIIRQDFDPVWIAEAYADHGAAAISVLTDEHFFQGHIDFLRSIHRQVPAVPLLRKDFTIDEYQIYEAREAGASAVLLITAILDKHQLVDFRDLAETLGMAALTEVHTEAEADVAAEYGARLIGINNRDLQTFDVDITRTGAIITLLGGRSPEFTFVGESGIFTYDHAMQMAGYGCDAVLVGESLMRQPDPGEALDDLLDVHGEKRQAHQK